MSVSSSAKNPSDPPKNDGASIVKSYLDKTLALEQFIRPYSQSSWPIWTVSGIFLASSLLPPSPTRPPIMIRFGFGAIFAGAGYVLSTGDSRNGSGISTAWSLTYLFLNLRKSLTPPRGATSLILTTATLASSTLYGTEYFVLQKDG